MASPRPALGWRRLALLLLSLALPCIAARAQAPTNVTGQYSIVPSGLTYNRTTDTYDTMLRITAPASALPVRAPLSLVVTSVSASGVVLANRSGYTADAKEKVDVALAGGVFAPGSTLNVLLKFLNRQKVRFTFAYRVDAVNPEVGVPVAYVPPPKVTPAALPVDAETGKPVLMAQNGFQFLLDTTARNRNTAMAACLDWVTSCLDPARRTLDDCARAAPQCKTAAPWQEPGTCCPAACYAQYRTSRLGGASPREAFSTTYLQDQTCMP